MPPAYDYAQRADVAPCPPASTRPSSATTSGTGPTWNINVNAAKEFNLKRGMNLQLRAEIFNLLNEDTMTILANSNEANVWFRDFGRSFQLSTRLAF